MRVERQDLSLVPMQSKSAVGHQIKVALKRIGALGKAAPRREGCKRATKGTNGGERRKRMREQEKERGKGFGLSSHFSEPTQTSQLDATRGNEI